MSRYRIGEMHPPLDRFLEWSLGCVIPPNSNICTCINGIWQKFWLKKSVPPVPGKYREWTEPIWGMIQVGLEHVRGTVLSRFKDCSGPDQGLFWTRTRNVLSMIEECSEPERGLGEAGLGMIWVRTETGPGLNQDLFRTCPGPTGTTEMPPFLLPRKPQTFENGMWQRTAWHQHY